ncbi:hypothetical protein DYI37_08955 [Fulvimarina endophytica]|uniref:Uncharacterized protein n=1 Tax=Fulvimarina endophytica TaxID=2293836 RepID=A0A371X5C4_9HYPH|nr:hypothetical protein [Fulvimarina endophytica]RFC64428.1 hypothetical protein DYI37_08955 [Fulvimarina endophytica]
MTASSLRIDSHGPDTGAAGATVIPFTRQGCPTSARMRPDLPAGDLDRLNRLRWLALKSRLAPRPDIERACYLLAADRVKAIEPVANAFFRGLDHHGSMAIELYRPGTAHPSPDEIWMLRLLAAFEEGREKEAAALVSWRIRPMGRRWMRFLAATLGELIVNDTAPDYRDPASA